MNRAGFIAGSAATPATALAAAGLDRSRTAFDRTAFEAILNRPARHRQLFTATRLANGAILRYMRNSLKAYADDLGEGPGTLHAVAVMYGPALFLLADDSVWSSYGIARFINGAPFRESLNLAMQDTSNPFKSEVASLARAGATFFVCSNALGGFAGELAQASAKNPAAVYEEIVARLLPPAMVVPAGVAAINAAQEARFTLLPASVG